MSEYLSGTDIEEAIGAISPLVNPRLSEVDWSAVAEKLQEHVYAIVGMTANEYDALVALIPDHTEGGEEPACPDCERTHPWRDHSDPAIEDPQLRPAGTPWDGRPFTDAELEAATDLPDHTEGGEERDPRTPHTFNQVDPHPWPDELP